MKTRLVVALLASTLGVLEARVLGASPLVTVLAGVGFGLVWTAIASLVALALQRAREMSAHAPDVSALLVGVANALLLGAGLILHLMFPSPESYLAHQQSASGAPAVAFYATLNPLTELVLVPLALYFNWRSPARRTLAIAGALFYYGERVATYLYFAPVILAWPDAPRSPATLDQVALWLNLDWSRMGVNAATIGIFLALTLRPVSAPRAQVAPVAREAALRGEAR